MVFNTNQARQLYVVKSVKTGSTALTTAGDVKAVKQGKCIYFQYFGADGLMRSDLIPISSITYAKATPAEKLNEYARVGIAALNSEVSSSPVAAKEYILGLNVRQFSSLGEEDSAYTNASVIAGASESASDLYIRLAIELAKNLKMGYAPVVKAVIAVSDDTIMDILPTDTLASIKTTLDTKTAVGVGAESVAQDWQRGTMAQDAVFFDLSAKDITVGGVSGAWGTITYEEGTDVVVSNNHKIADLEYFCMGERGDVYRNVCWPNVVPTTYLVEAGKQYDVVDIHYAYQGSCEDIQKSEKDITFVIDAGSAGTTHTEADKLIAAINSAVATAVVVAGVTEGDDTVNTTAGDALLKRLGA